ncbi:hypothetical protein EMIT0P201_20321 [Pseudomonas chlororaphis]
MLRLKGGRTGRNTDRKAQTEGYDGVFALGFMVQKCHLMSVSSFSTTFSLDSGRLSL